MFSPRDHAEDCSFHLDQYPHECDCGEVIGKDRTPGPARIDRQLLSAVVATLRRKRAVFQTYADLHRAKMTDEGNRKAIANAHHAKDITRVLDRFDEERARKMVTPCMNMVDTLLEMQDADAVIVTETFATRLAQELNGLRSLYDPQEKLISVEDVIGGTLYGLPIYLSRDPETTGVVVAKKGTPIMRAVEEQYARP